MLYALRQKVGNAAFHRIERAYVDRFRDRSVGTDDFIALAAQVSGRRDVVPFLRDWVYGTKTPPMPGHPDWTTNPPGTAQAEGRPAAAQEALSRYDLRRGHHAQLPLVTGPQVQPARRARRARHRPEDARCPAGPRETRAAARSARTSCTINPSSPRSSAPCTRRPGRSSSTSARAPGH